MTTKCDRVLAQMTQELTNCSSGEFAELSLQNSSRSRPALAGSLSSNAYHARSAHGAPPDVPLSPTIPYLLLRETEAISSVHRP